MRKSAPSTDDVYTVVDRPKPALKALMVILWFSACYGMYRVVQQPPADEPLALPGMILVLAICSYLLAHEFMLRPMRVTSIRPLQREIVIQETARWRKRERVIPIDGLNTYFEIFLCAESGSDNSYAVRFRSPEKRITVAEYLSKFEAERIAREANARLGRYPAN